MPDMEVKQHFPCSISVSIQVVLVIKFQNANKCSHLKIMTRINGISCYIEQENVLKLYMNE